MKFLKGFTLVEVSVSIFVFSVGMMGFMSYTARASSMVFDNESAQVAHSLALNLVEQINTLSDEDFLKMRNTLGGVGTISQDKALKKCLPNTTMGPFDSFGTGGGVSCSNTYCFYRMVEMFSYSQMTGVYTQKSSFLGLLYHVNIWVGWPKKESPETKCSSLGFASCNYVKIPLVKNISADYTDTSSVCDDIGGEP